MDGALSDEVLLAVFSNLAAVDLTRLQSVSKRINRLAQDPQVSSVATANWDVC